MALQCGQVNRKNIIMQSLAVHTSFARFAFHAKVSTTALNNNNNNNVLIFRSRDRAFHVNCTRIVLHTAVRCHNNTIYGHYHITIYGAQAVSYEIVLSLAI